METSPTQINLRSSVREELEKSRPEGDRIRKIINRIKLPEGISIYSGGDNQKVFALLNTKLLPSGDNEITAPTSTMISYLIARDGDKYYRYAVEFPFGAPDTVIEQIYNNAIVVFQDKLIHNQAREVDMDGGDLGRADTN